MNKKINRKIFIDLDKVIEVCSNCKKNKLRTRRQWNRKKILEEFSQKENVFLISENIPNVKFNNFSCALAHYDKGCLKNWCYCFKDLEKAFDHYYFWKFFDYPKS